MSGGILGFLPHAAGGGGILDSLNSTVTDNRAALMGLGLGLLSGQGTGMAAQGYLQGAQQDQRTRLMQQAQAEKLQKQQVLAQAATKLGIDPTLAQASPEVFAAVATNKLVPKDLSFQERLYNSLPQDQQTAARTALLGLNKDQVKWELKTVKNADGSETPVYFNPLNPAQTMPVPGYSTGQSKQAQAEEQKKQSADIVVQDIDRALNITKDARVPIIGTSTVTGGTGQLMSNIGGTKAHDVANLLNTIKANATFDRLQAMRQASPTGGALGAVSDNENKLLGAAIGSLEQSQSEQQFVQNLKRVKKIYNGIIHGPQAVDSEGNVLPQARQAVQGRGTTRGGINWSVD